MSPPNESGATPLRTVRVHARNEDFRIVQVQGNLFVCAQANGSCCCGWTEKGRAPINHALYEEEWQRRRLRTTVHLTFTGCLGPCAVGNSALLQLYGQSIWFKDLNDDALIPQLFDYIAAMVAAGQVVAPPAALQNYVYARYSPPPTAGDRLMLAADDPGDSGGLERLDPVCLMDVDPATAPASLEYGGRTWYFCAPGCKKAFERNPQEYIVS